ncbi:ferredoxin Fer [Salinibaculum salinum]|uniref:ferredoxin Fer n=1 Tax=Salinibaculum salinum TaxID=3131996 RepID=UPI0030EF28BB
MTDSAKFDAKELREWLDAVDEKETTQSLMLAIAYDHGADVSELASWYGKSETEVRDIIEELSSRQAILPIAEWEGIDFEMLADRWGLRPETIVEWFAALQSRPIKERAEIIHRYSQEESGPLLSHPEARVDFLDYDVIEDHGWTIDDEDLFEKASNADLSPSAYGRFVVEPEETILEAAENRGYSWPYACRGGACANCAVIVKEGDIAMPGQTVLQEEQVKQMNARLTCVGVPVSERLKLVMNVQQLDQFEDLRLPSPVSESEPSL